MTVQKICNACGSFHTDYESPTCRACYRPRPQNRRGRVKTDAQKTREQVYKTAAWKQVRRLALERDGYTCQICGTGQDLIVHHHEEADSGIDPYDLANLETLCRRCHGRLHNERRKRK